MSAKYRLTAQGIRDLNYYGPRAVRAVVAAPEGAIAPPEGEAAVVVAEPPALVAVAE
ncbi:MAG TPA: hypothetical protein VGL59_13710 [Polyangia bacterium]|jgi:hypothetical protein